MKEFRLFSSLCNWVNHTKSVINKNEHAGDNSNFVVTFMQFTLFLWSQTTHWL